MPSRTFILRGRDEVLAHPALAGGRRGQSGRQPLPRLSEIGDPVLAALWSPPVDDAGEILDGASVEGRIIAARGEEYVVIYRELAEYGPTPWLVGMYFRRADIDEPTRRLEFAEIFGGVALLLCLVLAVLMGRGLSRPLTRLADAAQAISDLRIERSKPLPRNLFRELDTAARAYNSMVGGLRWFETYVPKALVLRLMREGGSAELHSEERIVTVLFTDIVGFTGIGTRLSAQQLASFLNRHFALLAECIDAEHGTVDKYIGDSVMAFWGAPVAQADHALRACRAALAISRILKSDNERRAAKGLAPVRLRIGIHTGPAIVGNVGAPGRINYTLIGDTVNTAQRLEQYAKTVATGAQGEHVVAVVGDTTAAAVGDAFDLSLIGEVELRGRGEKTAVYRLVGEPRSGLDELDQAP
jgi:class 3 adenylate cyclase